MEGNSGHTRNMHFPARQIGPHTYLAGDYSLRCDTPEWNYWSNLAAFAFVVYIIGVPFSFWFVLYRARAANVAQYLSILAPFVRTLARANRTRAALAAYESASRFAEKLRGRRLGAGHGAVMEHKIHIEHTGAPHQAAAARARRDLRTVTGGKLDVRCEDLWWEVSAIVADADAHQRELMEAGRSTSAGGVESLDSARLTRRMGHFLAGDNLASEWVMQRCGFIFEQYSREWWWFENVRAARPCAARVYDSSCWLMLLLCSCASVCVLCIVCAVKMCVSMNQTRCAEVHVVSSISPLTA